MLLKFQLDIDIDDMVILPGYSPMPVIEVHDSGMIILWDDIRGVDVKINVPALMKNLLLVERTQRHVISQA